VEPGGEGPRRSPGLLLWFGVVNAPLIFGWVLVFRRGYSKSARYAGMAWIAVGVVLQVAWALDPASLY